MLALALCGAVLAACQGAPRQAGGGETPVADRSVSVPGRSVVMITVDTTRPDRLEPYGAESVATPVLARLAQRGVVFERAWAVAPITLVAHTSILSGQYPFEHGVRNNGIQYVADSVTTLAERFQDASYRTAAFVSAAVLDRRYGLDQGFDVYDDDLSVRRNRSPRMVADRPAEVTVESATAWLDQLEGDAPYFLWVHFYDPHASYSPPPPYRDTYRERLYDGEIAYMDEQIGRLLAHPRILGGSGDQAPVVTVIGDHGESLGDHGERTHAILAYDATLHIPWILHVPGTRGGLRVAEPVGQVDVMPTLLSLVGLPAQESIAGRDLVPVITRQDQAPNHPYYSETYLPYYTYGWAKLRVLHRGLWKLIDGPEPELYDRRRDPRELTNVHGQEPGHAHDLKRDLDEWLSGHEAEREARLELDSEAVAKLRSLGYVAVSGAGGTAADEQRPNPMAMIEQHVGLERARMLLADRLYGLAADQLERVLRRDPNNLAALIDLVAAREGEGEIAEAIELAERVQSLDTENAGIYLTLARLEAQAKRPERALELAEFAISRDPRNPDARLQKVTLLQQQGRFDEARAETESALTDHGEHGRTNMVYAQLVELADGRPEAAEARIRRVLEQDPFLTRGWLVLGRVLERGGRGPEAIEIFRQGLVRQPDDSELHGALGHALARLGQPVDASHHLREAIRLGRQFRSELHVSLGAVLAEMGQLEAARAAYDKVLAVEPEHPGARNNAAIALFRMGRTGEARDALESLVVAFPDHVDGHNNLAAIAVEEERWRDVIRHSQRTLELDHEVTEAWNNLAIAHAELGESAPAREAYEKALALSPDYWPARFNLGLLLRTMARHDEAVAAFELVLAQVPNHDESHLELGELFAETLAQPVRARTHWNAFLRHAPNHPRSDEIRRRLEAL